MSERRGHAVSGCLEGSSERPETWQGHPRPTENPDEPFLKVSGLLESAAGGHPGRKAPEAPEFYVPRLDHVWHAFGMERLTFGSNWPVSDTAGRYADVIGIVRPYVGGKGAAAEQAFYVETSRRVYKWVAGAHRTVP